MTRYDVSSIRPLLNFTSKPLLDDLVADGVLAEKKGPFVNEKGTDRLKKESRGAIFFMTPVCMQMHASVVN